MCVCVKIELYIDSAPAGIPQAARLVLHSPPCGLTHICMYVCIYHIYKCVCGYIYIYMCVYTFIYR